MTLAENLNQARALLSSGATHDAVTMLRALHSLHPEQADLSLLLADALHADGQLHDAVAAYAAALPLNEHSAEAWSSAACAHLALKAYGAASVHFTKAAGLAPTSGNIRYNPATSLFGLGRVDQAVEAFDLAERLDPALTNLVLASIARIIPGSGQANHAAVQRRRRRWATSNAPAPVSLPRFQPVSGRKIRIGYLSAFFGAANWMKPVFALINRHDRSEFEIYLLSDGDPPSAASGYRDHDLDVICDFRDVDNDQAAGIIADLGIDVLVDLNGYSYQQRLALLMRRPAQHIVGWFNMFATTGIDAFDWLVGDAAVIRPEEERFYSEKIHRLPGTYLAFEVLYDVPDIAPPPCLEHKVITFGCFGSQYKLTDEVLAAWAAILRAAPGSRLFLKNGALDDPSVRDEVLVRLAAAGVQAQRIAIGGREGHFGFLDAYRHVDIALDTFPYNGGTTTMEALWQGVPVLTCDGDRWASRTSKSLLQAAGLSDWVTPDPAAFIDRAVSLANGAETPAMLTALRRGMRDLLRASPACNAGHSCQSMETFYQRLCRGADQSAAPELD